MYHVPNDCSLTSSVDNSVLWLKCSNLVKFERPLSVNCLQLDRQRWSPPHTCSTTNCSGIALDSLELAALTLTGAYISGNGNVAIHALTNFSYRFWKIVIFPFQGHNQDAFSPGYNFMHLYSQESLLSLSNLASGT